MINSGLIPIKKIIKIINSCVNIRQLETCIKISKCYTKKAKEKGVVNYDKIQENLIIKILERKDELELTERFKPNIYIKDILKESALINES